MTLEILKVFAIIFIAELGDKTQLAVLGFASSHKPWVVFIGASLALLAVTAIGVMAGTTLGKFVPQKVMSIISGVLFIAIGIFYIFKGLH